MDLKSRAWLEPKLRPLQQALSEYSFANLFLFRQTHDYRLLESPLACISGQTYDGEKHLLPLFDLADAEPAQIMRLCTVQGVCLYPVSEEALGRLPVDRYQAVYQQSDSDYLYLRSDLAHYRGPILRKKLTQMRQFELAFDPGFEVLTHDLTDDAQEVLEVWLAGAGRPPERTDYAPAREALALFAELGLEGFLARTKDGRPAGFVLYSWTNAETVAVHFAKGGRDFPGIFPYLFNRLANALPEACRFLNFEQDLGNPRFRQNKRSYKPIALLKKYRVRPKLG